MLAAITKNMNPSIQNYLRMPAISNILSVGLICLANSLEVASHSASNSEKNAFEWVKGGFSTITNIFGSYFESKEMQNNKLLNEPLSKPGFLESCMKNYEKRYMKAVEYAIKSNKKYSDIEYITAPGKFPEHRSFTPIFFDGFDIMSKDLSCFDMYKKNNYNLPSTLEMVVYFGKGDSLKKLLEMPDIENYLNRKMTGEAHVVDGKVFIDHKDIEYISDPNKVNGLTIREPLTLVEMAALAKLGFAGAFNDFSTNYATAWGDILSMLLLDPRVDVNVLLENANSRVDELVNCVYNDSGRSLFGILTKFEDDKIFRELLNNPTLKVKDNEKFLNLIENYICKIRCDFNYDDADITEKLANFRKIIKLLTEDNVKLKPDLVNRIVSTIKDSETGSLEQKGATLGSFASFPFEKEGDSKAIMDTVLNMNIKAFPAKDEL